MTLKHVSTEQWNEKKINFHRFKAIQYLFAKHFLIFAFPYCYFRIAKSIGVFCKLFEEMIWQRCCSAHASLQNINKYSQLWVLLFISQQKQIEKVDKQFSKGYFKNHLLFWPSILENFPLIGPHHCNGPKSFPDENIWRRHNDDQSQTKLEYHRHHWKFFVEITIKALVES